MQVVEAWDAVEVPAMYSGQYGDNVNVSCSLVHQEHTAGNTYYAYGVSHVTSDCNVYTSGAPNNTTIFRSKERITLTTGFKSGNASVSHFRAYLEDCSAKSMKSIVVVDDFETIPFGYEAPITEKKAENEAENSIMNDIALYPNPNTGRFYIKYTSSAEQYLTIDVYNAMGTCIIKKQQPDIIDIVDLSAYPKGIYIVKMTTGTGTHSRKVVYQ